MAPGDDVQLPDLQVIQRYSLAVRGASAPAADVIAALQADLAWLTGGARRRPAPGDKVASARKAPAADEAPANKPAARKPAVTKPAVTKPAAKRTAAKKPAAKKTGARKA